MKQNLAIQTVKACQVSLHTETNIYLVTPKADAIWHLAGKVELATKPLLPIVVDNCDTTFTALHHAMEYYCSEYPDESFDQLDEVMEFMKENFVVSLILDIVRA